MTSWYRNEVWNASVERAFNAKLGRVRLKAQYLRIQGSTLAKTHPEAALALLDRYFALGEDHEMAQAWCDRATACIALGRFENAIMAYEAAIAREAVYPNMKTMAYLELPFLAAARQLTHHYPRARELLETYRDRLLFPVDHFKWHAARALIGVDLGDAERAREDIQLALQAAARDYSGFASHPRAGLVGDRFGDVIEALEALIAP